MYTQIRGRNGAVIGIVGKIKGDSDANAGQVWYIANALVGDESIQAECSTQLKAINWIQRVTGND